MDVPNIRISGYLIGRRLNPDSGDTVAEIVHIKQSHKPKGPAENAFIMIETGHYVPRARYISWINYFDLEYASHREVGAWELVEPAKSYQRDLTWYPYGWPEAKTVPTIGDTILEEMRGK
jgi:hypothetical protein